MPISRSQPVSENSKKKKEYPTNISLAPMTQNEWLVSEQVDSFGISKTEKKEE